LSEKALTKDNILPIIQLGNILPFRCKGFHMNRYYNIPSDRFIMGSLFVVTNRLDTLLGRELKEFDITTKQWFLSIVVSSIFNDSPTMKETAIQMGCSHQNVKQVAAKLKQKGLLTMEKDKDDQRITRISMTKKSDELWKKIDPKGNEFINLMYEGIDKKDLDTVKRVLDKIGYNLENMDRDK